jgi:hypothetical protein
VADDAFALFALFALFVLFALGQTRVLRLADAELKPTALGW